MNRNARLKDGVMKDREQAGAMDAYAEHIPTAQGGVMHVKDDPIACLAKQPVDASAPRHCRIQQSQFGKDGHTRRLDHQAGTEGARCIEPFEERYMMPGTMQEQRRCQSAWPTARDRNIQPSHHDCLAEEMLASNRMISSKSLLYRADWISWDAWLRLVP
jgi:hypothetical protein